MNGNNRNADIDSSEDNSSSTRSSISTLSSSSCASSYDMLDEGKGDEADEEDENEDGQRHENENTEGGKTLTHVQSFLQSLHATNGSEASDNNSNSMSPRGNVPTPELTGDGGKSFKLVNSPIFLQMERTLGVRESLEYPNSSIELQVGRQPTAEDGAAAKFKDFSIDSLLNK